MQTPYYCFSKKRIIENYNTLKASLLVDDLYYALKPNGEREVLRVLDSINANFEVASVGEYQKLKSLGVESERIICSLPVKPIQWLRQLYANGIRYFVFDNTNEYYKLKKYAPESKKIVRIDITDIALGTIEYGMSLESLLNASDNLINNVDGVTFYISHNHHIDVLLAVLDRCDILLDHLGVNKIVNIGGKPHFHLEKEDIDVSPEEVASIIDEEFIEAAKT